MTIAYSQPAVQLCRRYRVSIARGGPTPQLPAAGGYTLTPQEEQLLNSLVERINQTPLEEKDPDADALLNQKLSPNPDALYMLAQTVLVQNIALDQAKSQVAQLRQQVQQPQLHPQPAHTTSFLGRLLGEHDAAPAQQQAPAQPPYQPVPQYAPPAQLYQQYGQPPYQQTQYVPVGGQSSFLRGAMQTAAGVAAGALVFEGVESILHDLGHGGYGFGGPGYGMGGIGMGGERPVEVINNYYDEPGRGAEHHAQDDPNDNLRGFDQNAGSTSDQDTRAFADASSLDDPATFDDQNLDDQNLDDQNLDDQNLDDQSAESGSSSDDTGSFDDGGGFDSGSNGF
jgi:uncharacterized protein